MKIKKLKFFFLIVCIIQLFYLFHFRSGFKYEIVKNPFHENAGIFHAVSAEIIETNTILNKQKVDNFNLSEEFKKDNYLYQRTIEFNYPIRMRESSSFVFFLNNEEIPTNCKLIETGKYINFTQC